MVLNSVRWSIWFPFRSKDSSGQGKVQIYTVFFQNSGFGLGLSSVWVDIDPEFSFSRDQRYMYLIFISRI